MSNLWHIPVTTGGNWFLSRHGILQSKQHMSICVEYISIQADQKCLKKESEYVC